MPPGRCVMARPWKEVRDQIRTIAKLEAEVEAAGLLLVEFQRARESLEKWLAGPALVPLTTYGSSSERIDTLKRNEQEIADEIEQLERLLDDAKRGDA